MQKLTGARCLHDLRSPSALALLLGAFRIVAALTPPWDLGVVKLFTWPQDCKRIDVRDGAGGDKLSG